MKMYVYTVMYCVNALYLKVNNTIFKKIFPEKSMEYTCMAW